MGAEMAADAAVAAAPIAVTLGEFARGARLADVPELARERAKLLILDVIGIALAATREPYALRMRAGLDALAGMDGAEHRCGVIGATQGLPLRDALVMNAGLMHGLDFDDTHIESIVHPSCISLPMALSLGQHLDASGEEVLMAYLCALEVAVRLGWAAHGGFHRRGLHATGVVGHFAAAVGAGRMLGLEVPQIAAAQGIVVSTAMANQEFLQGGGWNKRLHPGWAAVAGLTAAQLARHGFQAPRLPYEGHLGLYRTLVGTQPGDFDLGQITSGLGSRWETPRVAVKPLPSCHATHAPGDCARILALRHDIDPLQIESIVVRIPQVAMHIVAEPAEAKRRPQDDYAAKFSVQYVVAAALHRRRFGLAELAPEVLNDEAILATAAKVHCLADPDLKELTAYPGGVLVQLRSGAVFEHYEAVNRGAGNRALDAAEIIDKFHDNADPIAGRERADALCRLLLDLERSSARQIMAALAR